MSSNSSKNEQRSGVKSMRNVLSSEEREALSNLIQQEFTRLREILIIKRVIALNILVLAYSINIIFAPQRVINAVDLQAAGITETDFSFFLNIRVIFVIFLIILYNISYLKKYCFFPVSVSVLVVAAALFGFDFHMFISFSDPDSIVRVLIFTLCRLVGLYLLFANAMDAYRER